MGEKTQIPIAEYKVESIEKDPVDGRYYVTLYGPSRLHKLYVGDTFTVYIEADPSKLFTI